MFVVYAVHALRTCAGLPPVYVFDEGALDFLESTVRHFLTYCIVGVCSVRTRNTVREKCSIQMAEHQTEVSSGVASKRAKVRFGESDLTMSWVLTQCPIEISQQTAL